LAIAPDRELRENIPFFIILQRIIIGSVGAADARKADRSVSFSLLKNGDIPRFPRIDEFWLRLKEVWPRLIFIIFERKSNDSS